MRARAGRAHGEHGGAHRGPGRQAVVDEHDDAVGERRAGPVAAQPALLVVELLPARRLCGARRLGRAARAGRRDRRCARPGRRRRWRRSPARRARRADLADGEDVERGPEPGRDRRGDGHPAPRQPEHDDVGRRHRAERRRDGVGQTAPGLDPIDEPRTHVDNGNTNVANVANANFAPTPPPPHRPTPWRSSRAGACRGPRSPNRTPTAPTSASPPAAADRSPPRPGLPARHDADPTPAAPRRPASSATRCSPSSVRKTFWTVSVWEDEASLRTFAAAEPHRSVMRRVPARMGDERVPDVRRHRAASCRSTWPASKDRVVVTDALRDRPYHHGNLAAAAIAAAEVEIARHGIADASLRKVADRAGVSHTAVGKRFGDKAGLLAAVAAEGYRVLGEGLGRWPGDMRAMGRAYVEFAVQRPALFSVMFQPTVYRADDPGVVAARAATTALLRQGVGQAGRQPRRAPPPSGRGRSSTGSPRSVLGGAIEGDAVELYERAGGGAVPRPVRRRSDAFVRSTPGVGRPTFPVVIEGMPRVAGMDRPPCRRPSGSSGTGYRSDPNDRRRRPPLDRPLRSAQARAPRSPGSRTASPTSALDLYVSAYAEAVTAAGGLPVHLPQHVDPAAYAGHLDGVLLSGGADVDPVPLRRGARPDDRARSSRARRRRAGAPRARRRRGAARARHLPRPAAAQRVGRRHAAPGRADPRPLRPPRSTTRFDEVEVEPGEPPRSCCTAGASASTRCTIKRSSASPTAGSSRHAAATARSRRSSGRATTLIAVQWHPELLAGAATDPLFALARRAGPRRGAGRRGLSRAPRPVVERRPVICCAPSATSQQRLDELGARRRPRLRLDGRRRQRLPGRQHGPRPPRAHGARRRRAVVQRVHRDVGAVDLGRDRVARPGDRRRHHEGHADRRRRHARAARPRRPPARDDRRPPRAGRLDPRRRRADGRRCSPASTRARRGSCPASTPASPGSSATLLRGVLRSVEEVDAWLTQGTVCGRRRRSSPTCRRWCCPRTCGAS